MTPGQLRHKELIQPFTCSKSAMETTEQCGICSKLTTKTLNIIRKFFWRFQKQKFFVIDFEQVNVSWVSINICFVFMHYYSKDDCGSVFCFGAFTKLSLAD